MARLAELGQKVAKEQVERLGDPERLERTRAAFVAQAYISPRRPLRWLAAAAVLGVLAVFAIVVSGQRQRHEVTFEVAGMPGEVSQWLAVSQLQDTPVLFSDGSTMVLRPGAQARVTETSTRGATLTIARGAAAVEVQPHDGAQWQLLVGPFEVTVTGTRFDVSWDTKGEVFTIEMHQGSVEIAGPSIVGRRPVVAGQRVEIAVEAPTAAAPRASTSARASVPSPPAASSDNVMLPAAPASRDAAPKWSELAAIGRYKEAFVAAESTFSNLCQTLPAGQLMLLADTARFAGNAGSARLAYRTLRARFPGTGEAARAAFMLGSMASQGGGHGSAVAWFQTYLQEAPNGTLGREALGRVLEAQHQQGSEAARNTAQQYLARYPTGPHAELARTVSAP